MTINNEIKIGLVVLAATIVAFLGFRFMSDQPLFSSVNLLYTKYDNVEGLLRGSTVYINGFKVGSVRTLEYLPEEDSILVQMSITEPVRIPKGSVAMLAAADVLGSSVIRIERTNHPETVPWGSFIKGEHKSGLLSSFSETGAGLADSVEVMLGLVNKTLRAVNSVEKNVSSDLDQTVSNFKKTSQAVAEVLTRRKAEIDSMIVEAHNTMANLSALSDSSSTDITSLIANLEAFSNELDVLSENLLESTEALNSILGKMDAGEGTVGLMLNDPSLYQNLDSLTYNLNDLILKIQENPGRYLKHMRLVDIF